MPSTSCVRTAPLQLRPMTYTSSQIISVLVHKVSPQGCRRAAQCTSPDKKRKGTARMLREFEHQPKLSTVNVSVSSSSPQPSCAPATCVASSQHEADAQKAIHSRLCTGVAVSDKPCRVLHGLRTAHTVAHTNGIANFSCTHLPYKTGIFAVPAASGTRKTALVA